MINFPKFDDDLGLDVEGYADGIGAGGDLRPPDYRHLFPARG